jgi:hypothetical protein
MSASAHSPPPADGEHTPLPVIANVTRVVTKVIDRLTGDRVEFPLMVAAAVVEALKNFGIEAQVMYGPAAWIEITDKSEPIWAGCWGQHFSFWAATRFGEVVDLNTSVAGRKRAHDDAGVTTLYSPPMLWSREVPGFYRYQPEGIAELELTETRDQERWERVLAEVREKCRPEKLAGDAEAFPNEPIICPGRRLLDDTEQTFRHFDRALSVKGLPPQAPF